MSPTLKTFEAKALQLPVKDRALLATHLIVSLDTLDPDENEQLWVKEAAHRYKEYKAGRILAHNATDVFCAIRKDQARMKISVTSTQTHVPQQLTY